MRTLRELFRLPRGFNADGRAIGLGLAAAMAKQRQEATRSVEDYLAANTGDSAAERPVTTASA